MQSIKKLSIGFSLSFALFSAAYSYGYVGFGGFHMQNNGDNANFSHSIGYLAFGGTTSSVLPIGVDAKLGYGYQRTNFQNLSNSSSLYYEIMAKFGFVPKSSKNFLNLVIGSENFFSKGVNTQLILMGIELTSGEYISGSKSSLTLSTGYLYDVLGDYVFGADKNNTHARLNEYSYVWYISAKALYKFNDKFAFYTKSIYKYYGLSASKLVDLNNSQVEYPKSESWLAGLEIGFQF